ncbi:hypothetical protein BC937DRAFT_87424 [Endogone sp. FLAS-F59071]|nr:hypothetical protein BC937DRAFT_87424 [Endogone sp. FLAS-F59071]|eukprot:RUS19462.1 hypothetical protein BC937DRAFT_87424 [Endogone sp. FLAS-F59071]
MTNRFVHRRLYRRFECGSGSSRRRLIRRHNSRLEVDVVIPDINGRISRIPPSYVNDALKRLGPSVFDNVVHADCKLKVGQREYWGHELSLSWKSLYFRAVFTAIHSGKAHPDVTMPQISDETRMPIVTVPIESPEETNFDEMLYWIYCGNDDRWLSTFTEANISAVTRNVRFLGISTEAVRVLHRFSS